MIISNTGRGFEIIQFRDKNGQKCSLQQSSLAEFEPPGSSAIWFGVIGEHRMHLDKSQVEHLLVHLQNWILTGKF